ncbi:carbohydrate ABC transporter permease [Ideonella sp.]|uniref:carbohydrate ABC transporter permease n=1 Tax=Ideonella sp. TaxID=1929293 RepID=UPI002B48438A|nr:carbohydrate ABC transporter permease [Ideonella sp.]HJV69898.1 carbohydrate ABC transporter permease [Ideonella sp.]
MSRLPGDKPGRWLTLARLPLWLLVAGVLLPYYWMSIGAFKSVTELVRVPPSFWAEAPTWRNFFNPDWAGTSADPERLAGILQVQVEGHGFLHFYANSLLVTFFVTGLSLLAASFVAFVLTKRPFPGSRLLFNLLLISMMVPWEVTIVPNFVTVARLGWVNTYAALLVPGLAKAFIVFYFRQIITSIPEELIDAATMDGAGAVRTWWSVVLPLLKPALAAIAIPVAVSEWNNFLWPLLVVNDAEYMTLPLQLGKMAGNLTFYPHTAAVLMAGSLLASLPAIVAFLLLQRQFVDGLTAGATKG